MKNILPALLFLTFSQLFSQNPWQGGGGGNMKGMMEKMKVGHLYGKVVDSTSGKAVEFASVQLIGTMFDTLTKAIKKDVVISGQLTQMNGDFSLEKINVLGKYRSEEHTSELQSRQY